MPECTSASNTTCWTPGWGEVDWLTSSFTCRAFRPVQKATSASGVLSPATVITRGAGVLLYIDLSREAFPLMTAAFHWSSGAKVVLEGELESQCHRTATCNESEHQEKL